MKRRKKFAGSERKSVIIVDGNRHFIENGQTKEIRLKPGKHSFESGTKNLFDYGDNTTGDPITINLDKDDKLIFDLTIYEECVYYNDVRIC